MKKIILILNDLGENVLGKSVSETIKADFPDHNVIVDRWNMTNAKGYSSETLKNAELVECVIVANTMLGETQLGFFPNLKTVQIAFSGYDHVDLGYCQSRGISVYNTPNYATQSVAELGVGLILSMLRDIPRNHNRAFSGNWDGRTSGSLLSTKTVGIMGGNGKIGARLSQLLAPFGCQVITTPFSPRTTKPKSELDKTKKRLTTRPKNKNYEGSRVTREEFFEMTDILVVAVPFTIETKLMITREFVDGFKKPSICLVVLSRGGIVNEVHLKQMMDEKRIYAAALDVFQEEPIPNGWSLKHQDNLILSPHNGWNTVQAIQNRFNTLMDNLRAALSAPINPNQLV